MDIALIELPNYPFAVKPYSQKKLLHHNSKIIDFSENLFFHYCRVKIESKSK